MKATIATAGLCAMVLALGLPAVLLAQEPAPAPAPASAEDEAPTVSQAITRTPEEASVRKASASVDMKDYKFSPATVTIDVGDTVTWTNVGEEDHDADGDGFRTGRVKPDEEATESFESAGEFKYVCTFHPDMKGTVVVVDTDEGTGGDDDKAADDSTDPSGAAPTTTYPSATSDFGSSESTSSSSLPDTGENEIPLIVIGAGLLVCGLLLGAVWRYQAGP